jgi:hypothetical protein
LLVLAGLGAAGFAGALFEGVLVAGAVEAVGVVAADGAALLGAAGASKDALAGTGTALGGGAIPLGEMGAPGPSGVAASAEAPPC